MASRNLNIYILSSTWMKDRIDNIKNFQSVIQKYLFKNIKSIKIRVITEFEPTVINAEVVQRTVNYAPIKDANNQDIPLSFYNQFLRNVHVYHLSHCLKMFKAFEEITQNNKNDINLILEDDMLYEDKMCYMLDKLFEALPEGYEMVLLGYPSTNPKKSNNISFKNTSEMFRVFPFSDSLLVSTAAATKIHQNFIPIKFMGNIQLSYVIEKADIKTLVSEPNMFVNGSRYGAFLSALNCNNALVFNGDYVNAKNIISKDGALSDQEKEHLDNLFEKSVIKNNPDLLYVKAKYLTLLGKYKEALEVYETALKVYEANSCIVNHESLFLKDYIRLYGKLQELPVSPSVAV